MFKRKKCFGIWIGDKIKKPLNFINNFAEVAEELIDEYVKLAYYGKRVRNAWFNRNREKYDKTMQSYQGNTGLGLSINHDIVVRCIVDKLK